MAMARGGREGGVDHGGPLPHHVLLRGFPARLPSRTLCPFPHGNLCRIPGRIPHSALLACPARLPRRAGGEERGEEAGRQRIRRRPRFGEFAQRVGDHRGAVGSQQADQVLPDQRRGQQSGVQPLPGQPYRLGLEHRVAAVRQFVHELRRPVRSDDARPPHGLVQEFPPGLVAEHRGVVEQIGAQPRDPYPYRQWPGRAPSRPGSAPQMVAEFLVQPGQEKIRLRRSRQRSGQQPGDFGRLHVVGRGALRDALGEQDQPQMALPGVLVPDQLPQGLRCAVPRVREPAGQGCSGPARGVVELFVGRCLHRRMLTAHAPAPPTGLAPPSLSVAAEPHVVRERQLADEGPHPQQAPGGEPYGRRVVRTVRRGPERGDVCGRLDVSHTSSFGPHP
ncbi:hypothetical protein [Streptomyces sp. NPDC059616]|uniref:hypothetical protein n=1 Tax=Streptomyces sp. NPDC059616 TaxID=3346886 RepID=UPI0036844A0D